MLVYDIMLLPMVPHGAGPCCGILTDAGVLEAQPPRQADSGAGEEELTADTGPR